MADVRRGDDAVRRLQGSDLCGQNDVAIERSVVGGRSSPLTSLGPEFCRLAHRRCREGQVFNQVDKRIEALEPLNPATPHQLAAHLVVGDFRQDYPGAAGNEPLEPARACQTLGRPPRVRHQAQRSGVERNDRIYHVTPLLLCWEERALGQTVFVQCVNEVVTRCSLFTGIIFVHPGLKHSYEIRRATLAWQILFEQLGSIRVDGHAAVFGRLSQAVSEFPVQVERHVHLNTPLCKDDRVAVPGPRRDTPINRRRSTTRRRVGSVGRPPLPLYRAATHAVDGVGPRWVPHATARLRWWVAGRRTRTPGDEGHRVVPCCRVRPGRPAPCGRPPLNCRDAVAHVKTRAAAVSTP